MHATSLERHVPSRAIFSHFHLSQSYAAIHMRLTDSPVRSSAPARRIEAPDTILVAVRARAPAAGLADGAAAASSGVGSRRRQHDAAAAAVVRRPPRLLCVFGRLWDFD